MTAPLFRDQLGLALRRVRKQRGLTLREVAERACTSFGYVSELETGRKEASSEMLASLCAALDIPLSRLLRDTASFAQLAETPVPDSPAELVVVGGVRTATAIAAVVEAEGVDDRMDKYGRVYS